MISALLTGFSLIIYRFGVNLDRLIGGIIILFILSFALETLVNVISAYTKKEKEYVIRYRSLEIFSLLFKKGKIKLVKQTLLISIPVLLLTYLSSSLFIINPDEEATTE